MVDEAHSFGAYGPRGLGCADAQGVLEQVDFVVGTFSKALAGVGGYCVSNHTQLTAAPFRGPALRRSPRRASPANIAGVEAALGILQQRRRRCSERLWDNVRRVRAGLARPRLRHRSDRVADRADRNRDRGSGRRRCGGRCSKRGVYVNIVLPPACRPDGCLLRTSYSAAHTPEQIDLRALDLRAGRPPVVGHRGRVMKLLLVNPRNRVSLYGDYLWQPLALGYVAAVTPPHWDVELIDEQCEGCSTTRRFRPISWASRRSPRRLRARTRSPGSFARAASRS